MRLSKSVLVAVLVGLCFPVLAGSASAADLHDWSCRIEVPEFGTTDGVSYAGTATCVNQAAPDETTSYDATIDVTQTGGSSTCVSHPSWTASGSITITTPGGGTYVDGFTLTADPHRRAGTVEIASGPRGVFLAGEGVTRVGSPLCGYVQGLTLSFTSPDTGIAIIQGRATAAGDCVFSVDLIAAVGGAASFGQEGFDPANCVVTGVLDTSSGSEVAEAQPDGWLPTIPSGVPDEVEDLAPGLAEEANGALGSGGDYPKADYRLNTQVVLGDQLDVDNRQYIHFWYDGACVHNSKHGTSASWNDVYDTYHDWYNNDYPNPDPNSGAKSCTRIESHTHSKWEWRPCGISYERAAFDENYLEGYPDGRGWGHVKWTLEGKWGCQHLGFKVKLTLTYITPS